MNTTEPGTLFLVVGASGSGKDSVITAARARLGAYPRGTHFVFPRRSITRPGNAPGEDHIPLTPEEFRRAREAGRFCLAWEAHGLSYGIGREITADLDAGRSVVVNVSRTIIPEAEELFPRVVVLLIETDPAAIRERLRQRGRETTAEIERRVQRATAMVVSARILVRIDNRGPLEEAAAACTRALLRNRRPAATTTGRRTAVAAATE
ncbi:MAG: phosphonate metabolism protein/1,5-bisphosphokinase (PRPP-forming) PhnN [Deltaproteobacteria bacterium]|nr:phosphonate metabolism protein/1,5-bisphosphokinase (PRPP-forming) PhnN [Candidatus Anaeroferrophillacea bacterium]